MSRLLLSIVVVSLSSLSCAASRAQDRLGPAPGYNAPYAELKEYVRAKSALPLTNEEKTEVFNRVLKSRIGERGMKNMFGGSLRLPVDTPGLENAILAAAGSVDTKQGKLSALGHRRTLVYADKLHGGGKFRVDGINQRFGSRSASAGLPLGDDDLLITSRSTGIKYSVEVKHRAFDSLRRTSSRLKTQIAKEIRAASSRGMKYVFVNRKEVPAEIRQFVEANGGLCLENVGSDQIVGKLAAHDQALARTRLRVRVGSGGLALVSVAFAGVEIGDSLHSLSRDWNASASGLEKSLLVAETSLRVGGAVASLVEPAALAASAFGIGAGSSAMAWVPGIGLVVTPTLVAGEVTIAFIRFQHGHLSNAEFYRIATRASIQASGIAVGAVAGGAIGSAAGPPGILLGASIGSGIGYLATSVGIFVYEWWYPVNASPNLFAGLSDTQRADYLNEIASLYRK